MRLRVGVDAGLEYKVARLHPDAMRHLGLEAGSAVVLDYGGRRSSLLAWTSEPGSERDRVWVDQHTARLLGVRDGDEVVVSKAYPVEAVRVTLAPITQRPLPPSAESMSRLLAGKPLMLGEVVGSPRVPRARLQVVSVEPFSSVVTVGGGTRVEVSRFPVAKRVIATRYPPVWSLACRGEELGSSLVLGVEPGPCAWVTPSTSVTVLDRGGLLRLLAKSGLVEEVVRSVESGGELGLHHLIGLLLLAWLLGEEGS